MINPVNNIIALLLLFFSYNYSFAQPADDEISLRTLLDDFLAGASVNDYEMHDRFWADDLIYTGSNGERISKSDIMSGLTINSSNADENNLPRYHAEEVQINLYGETAVVAFRLVAEVPLESSETGILNFYNTGTFLKKDGEWRAVAWQATRTEAE